MSQLNLENMLYDQLCEIAKKEGCSVEQLAQDILCQAVEKKRKPHVATRLMKIFSTDGLRDDETIEELKGQEVRSPDFESPDFGQ